MALGLALATAPAQALPLNGGASGFGAAAATLSQDAAVQTVRWRGRHGGYYHRHRRGYGPGAEIAGGIIGLAAGAAIAGAAAAPPPQAYYGGGDAVAYCMQRFRSYDPRSGTYLGYDGYRHPCP
jgi:hypothetical protein